MKKIILSFAFALTVTSTAHAQLPVTDAGSMAQNLANHLEEMVKFAQQIEHLKQQFEQQKMQFDALTGNRGFGFGSYNTALRDYLPPNVRQLYYNLTTGGYMAAVGDTANLLRQNQIFDRCASFSDKEQRIACEAEVVKPLQDKAITSKAYDSTAQRLSEVENLMKQIGDTKDPKGIAELQGRIDVENASIQNQATRLQLYQNMADAEGKIIEERQREAAAKENARREYPEPKPLGAAYHLSDKE
ncbi:P-type DNA transfer protein VirB5 [Brucella sp. 10RB9214]|uniref:P-type DNA transfer protein VirB5 n=1 Tax=unclassified Brucella TaxID=2632610 RepID=UPI000972A8CC|nr:MULTISPECIES: P-type DNA transfer protein VirB5 [unclassified Brucella]APY15340.1 P-type DNA transfer protein VirB5 [Brucella sp. 09RB8910]MRN46580.1 P-type DNA transfer protein VirB5 [Brucella sp. 10RB9212]MRN50631.1 P-type DNA transfer protein VirB5 [Brucella sp. 10RB9214]